jgi:hypothetical protein
LQSLPKKGRKWLASDRKTKNKFTLNLKDMSDNLREYYETIFEPGEHPVPFNSLTDEEKAAVQNTLGFAFWNLSRSMEKFVKVAEQSMLNYRKVAQKYMLKCHHKRVRRVR